jgi:hypothetical protein
MQRHIRVSMFHPAIAAGPLQTVSISIVSQSEKPCLTKREMGGGVS